MSKSTCTLFASFAVTASLFCFSAGADQLPFPTPSKTVTPEVTFKCEFEGGGSGKAGSWFKRCHAEGQFEEAPVVGIQNDENHLKVICDDGDDNDQDNRPIFDGGLKTRFDRDDWTLILKGVDVRDDDRRPPVITVFDIHQDELCPITRNDDHRYSSQIEFDDRGNDFILAGHCEFKCVTPVALN